MKKFNKLFIFPLFSLILTSCNNSTNNDSILYSLLTNESISFISQSKLVEDKSVYQESVEQSNINLDNQENFTKTSVFYLAKNYEEVARRVSSYSIIKDSMTQDEKYMYSYSTSYEIKLPEFEYFESYICSFEQKECQKYVKSKKSDEQDYRIEITYSAFNNVMSTLTSLVDNYGYRSNKINLTADKFLKLNEVYTFDNVKNRVYFDFGVNQVRTRFEIDTSNNLYKSITILNSKDNSLPGCVENTFQQLQFSYDKKEYQFIK